MSKDILALATRYAGNSSVISDVQCALDVMPLIFGAVNSACEQTQFDENELFEGMDRVKRFLLAKQAELHAESVSIRAELSKLGENDE
ncbi:hypothetical protein RM843_004632 [Salmonella enterica]|nr:hypothetical protein [Salmonella enterica subsp. enterica]ELD2883155.1 hypothetical protein [Salmonella enterica]ELE9879832.1 hypothetical protein [Salmonella enterica]